MLIMVIFWQFVCILIICLGLFPEFNLWSTHIKINCLNLGIAQKGGEGVLGLPKLFGALFY